MKKEYQPLNMIMNGRYAVLYGKLAPAIQKEVLSRMAGLIEEERDYEDKGNYGHFCNILPTIAIDDVLQRNGKSPEEAFELISTHMWAALNPEGFQKLSKLPFFLSVMRKIIPLGFKYGSGKGWKYVWHPEDPKEYYHFETLECLYRYDQARCAGALRPHVLPQRHHQLRQPPSYRFHPHEDPLPGRRLLRLPLRPAS